MAQCEQMHVAWFTPMPPVRSGIARDSAELVGALRAEHDVDVFVDEPVAAALETASGHNARSAHEFIWRHRQAPYDLTIFQVGNSSHHDYLWPYLFRYPGLTVLHDAHLHHARAAALLRSKRADDYRAEFSANHPDVNPDAAELAVAGFDSHLYYRWPMTRLVVQASRLAVVHTRRMAEELRADIPGATVDCVRLGHGVEVQPERASEARHRVRARYGIPEYALVFGLFGGLTPDKRIAQVLDAFAAVLPYAPEARLLLAGAAAAHYDPAAAVRQRGLEDRTTITGYLEEDDQLTDCIAACDVTLNLRWPTAREVSGPWLRCLAAAKPTIVTDLAHMTDVPSLDPRTWRAQGTGDDPVCVAIDIVDEDHSLRLAMRRLATDADLRSVLGTAGQTWWKREHAFPLMLEDYRRVIARAAVRPAPRPALPSHLVDNGDGILRGVMAHFAIDDARLWHRDLR